MLGSGQRCGGVLPQPKPNRAWSVLMTRSGVPREQEQEQAYPTLSSPFPESRAAAQAPCRQGAHQRLVRPEPAAAQRFLSVAATPVGPGLDGSTKRTQQNCPVASLTGSVDDAPTGVTNESVPPHRD